MFENTVLCISFGPWQTLVASLAIDNFRRRQVSTTTKTRAILVILDATQMFDSIAASSLKIANQMSSWDEVIEIRTVDIAEELADRLKSCWTTKHIRKMLSQYSISLDHVHYILVNEVRSLYVQMFIDAFPMSKLMIYEDGVAAFTDDYWISPKLSFLSTIKRNFLQIAHVGQGLLATRDHVTYSRLAKIESFYIIETRTTNIPNKLSHVRDIIEIPLVTLVGALKRLDSVIQDEYIYKPDDIVLLEPVLRGISKDEQLRVEEYVLNELKFLCERFGTNIAFKPHPRTSCDWGKLLRQSNTHVTLLSHYLPIEVYIQKRCPAMFIGTISSSEYYVSLMANIPVFDMGSDICTTCKLPMDELIKLRAKVIQDKGYVRNYSDLREWDV